MIIFSCPNYGRVLLASSGERLGIVLNILQYKHSPPQQRIIYFKMVIVLRLRNLDLE